MSFKKKLMFLLAAVLIVSLCVGIAVSAADEENDGYDATENEQDIYVVEVAGSTMKVNKENLSLEIEKDGHTWYSGRLFDEDLEGPDQITSDLQKSLITDAVTVTYYAGKDNYTTRGFTYLAHSVKFTEKTDGFDATVSITGTVGITFKLQVRFDGSKLTATIPYSSIKEKSPNLTQINIYPYFDSSYKLTEGEIFIPDGSGALIDLSVNNSAKSAFSARVYGDDYGFASTNLVRANSPARVTMPVVATLYPDGGTMAVATSGAEYSKVNAAVSSMSNNFNRNRAYFSFIYREQYVRTYDSALGNTATVLPEDKNEFDAQVTYQLLPENSDVADLATIYRNNYLDIKKSAVDNVGLRLQFLMADNKQGMFERETVEMTTPEFVEKIAKEVTAYCNNLSVSLKGYQSGGLGGASPSIFPMKSSSKYKALSEELAKLYVQLNFNVDYVRAHDRSGVSNYNLAQNISEQFIVMPDVRAGSTAEFSLVKPSYSENLLAKDLKKLNGFNNTGIEFETLGALLFSGFKQEIFTRSQLIEKHIQSVSNSGVYASISNPNDYMFGVIDAYVDAPLEYSSYLIETESVPFLQMVLSGYVPMYSSALNLDFTGQGLVLRLIDSNVYPSFILTEQDPIELYGTESQGIYTSSFDIWKYSVKETYEQVDSVLREVVGQTVVTREKIASNVYVTTYSNGVKVVVNYSKSEINYQGYQIGAESAIAVR